MDFIVFQGKNGKFWWHVKAHNGKIMADSGQGYKRKRDAHIACIKFKLRAMYSPVIVK